ncbi:MAG TPA: hypothetical protein VD978_32340 [Azospirillum sp.]|nr:hypothetical protein [Azospirillum sp.]
MDYEVTCYMTCSSARARGNPERALQIVQWFLERLKEEEIDYAVDVRNIYAGRTELHELHQASLPPTKDKDERAQGASACNTGPVSGVIGVQ